jgi:N-ethylmaleimide reductase
MANLDAKPLQALEGDGMFTHFRHRYRGTLIANVGMTRDCGNQLITDGLADLVAFGEPFIANPDLPARFASNAAIARSDQATHYTPGPDGYIDYLPQDATTTIAGEVGQEQGNLAS